MLFLVPLVLLPGIFTPQSGFNNYRSLFISSHASVALYAPERFNTYKGLPKSNLDYRTSLPSERFKYLQGPLTPHRNYIIFFF